MDLPDTMEVGISVQRGIVVNDNVDTLHIDTTTENISGNKDTLFEGLESGVTFDTSGGKECFLLVHGSERHTVLLVATRSEC